MFHAWGFDKLVLLTPVENGKTEGSNYKFEPARVCCSEKIGMFHILVGIWRE